MQDAQQRRTALLVLWGAAAGDIEIRARLAKGERLEDIITQPQRRTPSQIIAEANRTGELNVEDPVHAVCPCGQEFLVGYVDGMPVALHAEPYCREFADMDLTDYLHWVNVKSGAHN